MALVRLIGKGNKRMVGFGPAISQHGSVGKNPAILVSQEIERDRRSIF